MQVRAYSASQVIERVALMLLERGDSCQHLLDAEAPPKL